MSHTPRPLADEARELETLLELYSRGERQYLQEEWAPT